MIRIPEIRKLLIPEDSSKSFYLDTFIFAPYSGTALKKI
jgi:hypothetical protein